jgi:glycosyltransferase involved in cell wall biosynthesis
MASQTHILLNAMANTGAGAFTVARQLARHLAEHRPDWRFTLLLVDKHPLHDQVQSAGLPSNCLIERAPTEAQHWRPRLKIERLVIRRLMAEQGINATVQLNGMLPAGAPNLPALCHNQDPWPYRPESWDAMRERMMAFLRRRAHARAFCRAAIVGFTSNYLRELMVEWLGFGPKRTAVFYNGLPDSWLARAAAELPSWRDRPMELLSVSSVGLYKRQELVIRALPQLIRMPGCADLTYRIVGHLNSADYRRTLTKMAQDLGVADRVFIEGRLPDDRVEQLYCQARCFVLMSICESFGLPAIEAMSFGTPVVTSNCCAMPEVCGSGAILSPVDDLPALVKNLHRVLTDEPFAEDLRHAGARNCQRFKWTHTAATMADELQSTLSSR